MTVRSISALPISNRSWGYHLSLNCSGCRFEKMRDKNNVLNWLSKLLKDLGETVTAEPQIEYTSPNDATRAGYMVAQILESSIFLTTKFVDNDGHIYFDIFTVKEYDTNIIEQSLRDAFGAIKIQKYLITRQAV